MQRHCDCCAGKDGKVEPGVSSSKHSNSHVYWRTWEDREKLAFKNNACRFSRVFFFSILSGRWTDDHPQQDFISQFGYKSERKVRIFWNPCYMLTTCKNLWSEYDVSNLLFFGLKINPLWAIPLPHPTSPTPNSKILCTSDRPFLTTKQNQKKKSLIFSPCRLYIFSAYIIIYIPSSCSISPSLDLPMFRLIIVLTSWSISPP
jgi:hypothetical protein